MTPNKNIDDILLELLELKNNFKVPLKELQDKIEEADQQIFKNNCLKPYLSKCEPEYCGFRMTGECRYIDELSRLKALIKE